MIASSVVFSGVRCCDDLPSRPQLQRQGSLRYPAAVGTGASSAALIDWLRSKHAHAGPIIGRERELKEIGELLQQDGVRLVTFTGLGGIGKTRLAHEAAARTSRHDFPDGSAVMSLTSVRDPGLLAEVIAQNLSVPELPARSREQDLLEFVKTREMLLVLDNVEQVRDGRSLVAQILKASPPGIVILVTSPHVLEIGWERAYAVTEMAPPVRGQDHSVALLRANDAARLFESCAIAANPVFHLTDLNASQIAEICRTVEGIPLARELASDLSIPPAC